MDAVRYLEETEERFDVILMDCPTPTTPSSRGCTRCRRCGWSGGA